MDTYLDLARLRDAFDLHHILLMGYKDHEEAFTAAVVDFYNKLASDPRPSLYRSLALEDEVYNVLMTELRVGDIACSFVEGSLYQLVSKLVELIEQVRNSYSQI